MKIASFVPTTIRRFIGSSSVNFGALGGISLEAEKFLKTRVQRSDFFIREAKSDDFSDVKDCALGAIDKLDYLPAYYHRYLQQPNRTSIVVVHKPTNKAVYFCSCLVVDNGKTAVASSGRCHVSARKHGLSVLGYIYVASSASAKYPECTQSLGVTRIDQSALFPRTLDNLQTNKLLGTNSLLNVASSVADAEKIAKNLRGSGKSDVNVASIPFQDTCKLLGRNVKIQKLLIGGQYVVMDSFPYKLGCDSNFTQYPDLFNTRVYVGSPKSNPVKETDSIDSASFVNITAVEVGINVKLYVYASTVDAVLSHLRHGVLDSLAEIERVRASRDTLELTKNCDNVHYTLVFPLMLDAKEVRKRLYESGYKPSTTGTDIQRQYLFEDQVVGSLWKTGFSNIPFDFNGLIQT